MPETATKAKKITTKAKTPSGAFAVIATGGKQYKVAEGDSVRIEKLLGDHKEGKIITFGQVLLVDNGTPKVGTPLVAGAKVEAKLEKIGRAQKVVVIKYKQKSRYFKKNGHRQPFFQVKITSIK
jgi:large subunit ribosomal protein L21